MTIPGVEPGLSRPRRDVLATRRYGQVMIVKKKSSAEVGVWPSNECVAFRQRDMISRVHAYYRTNMRPERFELPTF